MIRFDHLLEFGEVVLLLDEEAIKQRFKVVPFAWNATIKGSVDAKKEREEFIIAEKMEMTKADAENQYCDILDGLSDEKKYKEADHFCNVICNKMGSLGYLRRPAKKSMDFSKYVKGFLLTDKHYCVETTEEFKKLESHPLFLGYFSREKARKNQEKSDIYHAKRRGRH